jgi:flagellar biosynthetic protein FliR
MSDLAQILDVSQANLWAGFVVFLRIGAMVSLLPAFGEQVIPIRVRLGVAMAFTMVVLPGVANQIIKFPGDMLAALPIVASEAVAGLFFGLLLRFFIFALQTAGAIAAQSTSLSQIFGGSAGADPQPAIGHVLTSAALALVALTGMHTEFAAYMIQTYLLVPIGFLIGAEVVADLGLKAVGHVFALGFTLAAPFVIASLVYNVTLGVINRAMPQLMVSFVGAPAITAGGLLLLLICAPVVLQIWMRAFASVIADPGGAF